MLTFHLSVSILLPQNINLIEEMIKEKKLEDEEKALFRKDYAEPLWEEFKLWTPEDKYYTLLPEF